MKENLDLLPRLFKEIPVEERERERGLSKKQFADALGRRPSEITKWLSGQHNFTISTLAMLSTFFGKSIITV